MPVRTLRSFTRAAAALALVAGTWLPQSVLSEESAKADSDPYAGLAWRNVGPAFMSGRIAHVAWDPTDSTVWYVAVGSGSVWKTTTAGVTWEPIFDDKPSYSIGYVAVDPRNPHRVWVGTGEDVGGRHVGFGDGVYRSDDGGQTWQHSGLEKSEHIARILVHPENSDVIWVAAQGPLWSKGGQRGLYMSTDGGKTWDKTLGAGEWTGVTDLVMDPRNPDVLYAATWQRHRTVAAYMGGGPESGIHRSDDGGRTWTRLSTGLPTGNLGKIGLAISPQQPDVVYAAIELNRRAGGVWRSDNRGASWVKGADAVGGGTGPHYYQELFADPHHFDRLYLVGPQVQRSEDGGKSFVSMPSPRMHGDVHAINFHPSNPNYLMMGTDGGLYESFDQGTNWRYMANLPVTQFYKMALDDSEPFYNIYGGTQDNNTQGGPSRTDNVHGVRNSDWFVLLGGDGHQPATEPGNPNIVYAQWQQGNIVRIDRTTDESVYIKPQPAPGEPPERYNWDSPILVSPHDPARLYFASQRLWRSDSRGDDWRAVSGDLTRNQDRMHLSLMDSTWSWDAPWDLFAMSDYNTITSVSESPLVEGLLYVGTDDGLLQVSENGGESWRRIEVGALPGVPASAFVNDIRADLHDPNTVYVALDNHKYGDFKPYLLVSRNRGRSWTSLAATLPDRHLVWRLVQDHERPELLFVGTEFGVFFTLNAGQQWYKLQAGMPTIAIRDIQIQRRENDLVAASFGRGFFVLDDYSPLRALRAEQLQEEALLFTPRDGLWYLPREVLGSTPKSYMGDDFFVADNPPFGVNFTYHLGRGFETRKSKRQAEEASTLADGEAVRFAGWEAVEAERREQAPAVHLVVRDSDGAVVRRIEGPAGKGFHRVAWNLRHPFPGAVETGPNWQGLHPEGFLAMPGNYTAELTVTVDGISRRLAEPVSFAVKRLYQGSLPGATEAELDEFLKTLAGLHRQVSAAGFALDNGFKSVELLQQMLARAPAAPGPLDAALHRFRSALYDLDQRLNGDRSRAEIGDYDVHNVRRWLMHATAGVATSTYGPTPAHRRSLQYAQEAFEPLRSELKSLLEVELPKLRQQFLEAGAPWGTGQPLPIDLL